MENGSDVLVGFKKLYNFSRLLLESDDPESLLSRLVEATRQVTDADEVILFDVDGGEPAVREVASNAPEGADADEPEYSQTLVDEVIERGTPLLLKDVCHDPRFEQAQSVQVLSITSAMGAPLFADDELKGIVYASRQRMTQNFTDQHGELMTVAASLASLLMDRVASMEALRESEFRHRSLVEMSPSTVAVIQQRRLVFANRRACRLWDAESVQRLLGTKYDELFDPWKSKRLVQRLKQAEDFDEIFGWTCDVDGDGGCPVKVVGRAIQFDGRPAMQLRISEVEDDSPLIAQRLRSDRLMLMGTMAATVGHEINNPLSYVHANLDFVAEEFGDLMEDDSVDFPACHRCEDVIEALESAREGAERIRGVIDSIQHFTRVDDEQQEPATVEEALKSALRVAREKLSPDVELQVDVRPTPPVELNAAQFGQVLLNLLTNAAQALADDDQTHHKRLEVRNRQEADEVVVEIADNGPGIAPQIRRHIFKPFVSTKSDDAGTGLGLSICRKIVESAEGTIEVESQPGEGSLFCVRLPAATEVATRSFEVVPESASSREQGGRILIVDPEPTLGRSLQRVLQDRHEVVAVQTKGEAVELLSGSPSFDVVLCDHRLRGGMGRDLFRWIQDHAPHYWDRLVAMTANRVDPRSRQTLEQLPNPWIAKPFDLDRLRGIIDRLVDSCERDADAS